jgi:hypothetical protein
MKKVVLSGLVCFIDASTGTCPALQNGGSTILELTLAVGRAKKGNISPRRL